jgi:predicted esterase
VREYHIRVARAARYDVLGPEAGSRVREIWYVLHGYGQLASTFVRLFEPVDDGTRLIVAPEALNRFYMVDVATAPAAERPVGATWMTREDRLNEIEDYVAYLDAVAAEVQSRVPPGSTPRVVLLGFSQGGATAARWAALGKLRPTDVVLWGALLPPDLDLMASEQPLREASLHIVIGARDRFVIDSRIADEERRLRRGALAYDLVRYDGGHGIGRGALVELARRLGGTPNE